MTAERRGERLHVWVPPEIKQALEEDDRTMTEAVVEYLEPLADGKDTRAAYERRLEELHTREEELVHTIEDAQAELEEVRQMLEDVQAEYEAYMDEVDDYETRLNDILDGLVDNPEKNVHAYRSEIVDAARFKYGRNTEALREQVLADLRECAQARGLGLDPSRFHTFSQPGPEATADTDGGDTVDDDGPLFESVTVDGGGD